MQFAIARRRLFPDIGSEWMECAGAYAVFDGIDAPTTQTFGLGIFEELSAASLDVIERFFLDRGAQVFHEVSPLAGVTAFDLLCTRGYRPIEISNVMYRAIENPAAIDNGSIRVRVTGPDEAQLWTEISARAWAYDYPELLDFLMQMGPVCSAREGSPCFLAEFDGQPGAAGVLSIHGGVALFGGAATIPELRRHGLQAALLQERMLRLQSWLRSGDDGGGDWQQLSTQCRAHGLPRRVHTHQVAAVPMTGTPPRYEVSALY